MNAPKFDITRVKGAYGSSTWMNEMQAEETRCCETIDARIKTLEDEESALLKESIAVEKQLETTSGFFARLSLKSTLGKLDKDREWRRLALIELYEARVRRTMTW